jgi:hypothetical protein
LYNTSSNLREYIVPALRTGKNRAPRFYLGAFYPPKLILGASVCPGSYDVTVENHQSAFLLLAQEPVKATTQHRELYNQQNAIAPGTHRYNQPIFLHNRNKPRPRWVCRRYYTASIHKPDTFFHPFTSADSVHIKHNNNRLICSRRQSDSTLFFL